MSHQRIQVLGPAQRVISSDGRLTVTIPIKMRLGVNTSPFAGKCKQSKFLTSRHIKDRLEREAMKNLAIRIEPTEVPDTFIVLGRGELYRWLSVLLTASGSGRKASRALQEVSLARARLLELLSARSDELKLALDELRAAQHKMLHLERLGTTGLG